MIENLNYPIPDPAWDYAEVWHRLQEIKTEYEKLLEYLSGMEDSTTQTDAEIKNRIDAIGQDLNSTRRLLNE
jgi:cytochrome c556